MPLRLGSACVRRRAQCAGQRPPGRGRGRRATHYHREHTEIYYILECAAGAAIELDGERVMVGMGHAVMIPPGVRHRAVGRMTILNIVVPPFDPADEWFD